MMAPSLVFNRNLLMQLWISRILLFLRSNARIPLRSESDVHQQPRGDCTRSTRFVSFHSFRAELLSTSPAGLRFGDQDSATQSQRIAYRKRQRFMGMMSSGCQSRRTHSHDFGGRACRLGCQLPLSRRSTAPEASGCSLLPYSFSLLCRVLRLMPRISAARVLLL